MIRIARERSSPAEAIQRGKVGCISSLSAADTGPQHCPEVQQDLDCLRSHAVTAQSDCCQALLRLEPPEFVGIVQLCCGTSQTTWASSQRGSWVSCSLS